MNDDDRKFEAFLREFEPRRPRPLPVADVHGVPGRRLAAAAC